MLKSLIFVALITCSLISNNSFAAKKIDVAKEDLSDVKQKIEALKKELDSNQAAHHEAVIIDLVMLLDVIEGLEAIDLANGQTLADDLAKGAKTILSKRAASTSSLGEWLFRSAYSRSPSTDELAVTREVLGATPDEQRVQDLLWAIIMQPEFQLIR